mmetsp:Transcript_1051/g.2294  ORF Transcript_1051/g.2294 Transcript_1051/m.2294 type:complete len:282 (+) Transcript_1051:1167-2012(+)
MCGWSGCGCVWRAATTASSRSQAQASTLRLSPNLSTSHVRCAALSPRASCCPTPAAAPGSCGPPSTMTSSQVLSLWMCRPTAKRHTRSPSSPSPCLHPTSHMRARSSSPSLTAAACCTGCWGARRAPWRRASWSAPSAPSRATWRCCASTTGCTARSASRSSLTASRPTSPPPWRAPSTLTCRPSPPRTTSWRCTATRRPPLSPPPPSRTKLAGSTPFTSSSSQQARQLPVVRCHWSARCAPPPARRSACVTHLTRTSLSRPHAAASRSRCRLAPRCRPTA